MADKRHRLGRHFLQQDSPVEIGTARRIRQKPRRLDIAAEAASRRRRPALAQGIHEGGEPVVFPAARGARTSGNSAK
jgi:hypothetical protein